MTMNKVRKSTTYDKSIQEFVHALNGVLQLTNRELELLEIFIKLEMGILVVFGAEKADLSNVANRYHRKHIIKELGISKDNLSRYIKHFKDRGILIAGPAEDALHVWKPLLPVFIGDRIQITIILRIEQNEADDD